jgi:xanthine dehydrogenase accessory factor
MLHHFETLTQLLADNTPCVAVTMVEATGSVPQTVGAKMLVGLTGLLEGTIGGGKLEKRSMEEAQALLNQPPDAAPIRTRLVRWSLDQDIGMTCGGSVTLFFEAFNVSPWTVVLFGAGHVAQSLSRLLVGLDCRILCIDPRPDWLEKLPPSPKLQAIQADPMADRVADLPDHAFVLLMTMGHATDWPILQEILKTRSFPYLGVIGSQAKAARLRKAVIEAGLPDEAAQRFYCPIGLDLGNNHPQEIAISVVAQLLQERDRWLTKR